MQRVNKRKRIIFLLLDGRCIDFSFDARFNQRIGIVVYRGEAVAAYLFPE